MSKTIQEQLVRIQKNLKAPKGQFNKFGNYKYRSCEDILEAVKPLLEPCALTLDDEIVLVGNRVYVKATATIIFNQDKLSVSAYAREEENKKGMDSSQLTGSTSSYARKYALNGLFCIDDNKDSDATNTHDKKENKVATRPSRPEPTTTKSSTCQDYKRLFQKLSEVCNGFSPVEKRNYLENTLKIKTLKGLENEGNKCRELLTILNKNNPTVEDFPF